MSEEKTIFKTISEQLIGLAQKIGQVFELGRKAEYDAFWDTFQENGNAKSYRGAFRSCWNDEIFKPKYDIRPNGGGASQMFQSSKIVDLKGCLERQGIVLDTSECTTFLQMFQDSSITSIPTLDISKCTNMDRAFDADAIITIEKLIVSENTTFTATTFYGEGLENIVFEGVIGNNIDFRYCTKLTKDSLLSIIAALKSGVSGLTCTLGTTNLAKLTDAEKAVATGKGWELK